MNCYLMVFLFFCLTEIYAQKAEVAIKVKDTVNVGIPFSLEIELKNVQGAFKTPDFQGLRLVGGPNTSSSFSFINGESTSKTTYTYFLMADEEGTFTIILHDVDVAGDILTFDNINVTAVSGSTGDSSLIRYYETGKSPQPKIQGSKRKLRKI